MFDNPTQVWEDVRAAGGVAHRSEIDAWVVVDYEHVRQGLRDPRLSNEVAGSGPAKGPLAPLLEVLRDQLFLMDPPRHRRLRKLVAKAFTPRSVEALEDGARADCTALLDFDHGDFVARFAYPYPVQVIARLFGIPAHEHAAFRDWSNDIAAFVVQYKPSREVVGRALKAVSEIKPFLRARVRSRQPGGDDLLAQLLAARDEGDGMHEEEIVHTAMQFLIAGHETTTNLLGNIVLALARDPALLDAVREQPALASAVVEETLRHDPSVQMVDRIAKEAMQIGQAQIKAGDRVMLSVAGANRDPALFENPDQFVLDRANVKQHLGFGFGIHVCLGAALTRLETRLAVEQLAATAERIEVTGALDYRPSTTHRGLVSLPVRFARTGTQAAP
ncbi:MAG: cytochrome P450 [Myxococcota bacterium]